MFNTTRAATIDRLTDVLQSRMEFYARISKNSLRVGITRDDLVRLLKQDMQDFVKQNMGPKGVPPLYRVKSDPKVCVEFIGENEPTKIVKRLVYGD